jgi:hypothetical protein
VLAKLLVLLKSTYKQEARKATLLQAADSFKVSASQVRSQSTKTSIQASLSALPPLSITPPPPPTNSGLSQKSAQIVSQLSLSSQDSSLRLKNNLDQQTHQPVVTEKIKKQNSIASTSPQIKQTLFAYKEINCTVPSTQGITPPDQGLHTATSPPKTVLTHSV